MVTQKWKFLSLIPARPNVIMWRHDVILSRRPVVDMAFICVFEMFPIHVDTPSLLMLIYATDTQK